MHKIFLSFVLFIFIFLLSGCSDSLNANQKSCERLNDIINDSIKVAYLKDWVSENVNRVEFINIFESNNQIYAQGNSRLFGLMDIDWSKIGVEESVASMSIFKSRDDDSKVNIIRIGEGRNDIVLSMNTQSNEIVFSVECD